MFEAPAGLAKLDGQPVEQFWVGGRGALGAEVVFGFDEAASEVLLPDTVDEDAGGEWVLGRS